MPADTYVEFCAQKWNCRRRESYFDEFGSRDYEFRAFREFVEASGMRFELVAQANSMWNVAV